MDFRDLQQFQYLKEFTVVKKSARSNIKNRTQTKVRKKAKPDSEIDWGLLRYFNSESEAILAQYRRVQDLLGEQSHDFVHTGTLCEMLLRDFLRRVVLPHMAVEKGFVFGKSSDNRRFVSSPEIDILIHDTRRHRPLYRHEDFVIVQPESVLGVIQVKKRLVTSGDNQLRKGLTNILRAKSHVVEQVRQNGGTLNQIERSRKVFSAVIGFEGQTKFETYGQQIFLSLEETGLNKVDADPIETILPNFVGSLTGRFVTKYKFTSSEFKYSCGQSCHDEDMYVLQFLADMLANQLWYKETEFSNHPPFQFPEHFRPEAYLTVNLRDGTHALSKVRKP